MYNKLKAIQKLLWKDDDMIEQETLFDLQNLVAKLTLEVAEKENKVEDLVKSFKWLYKE